MPHGERAVHLTTPADAFVALTLDTGEIIEGLPASVRAGPMRISARFRPARPHKGRCSTCKPTAYLPFANRGLVIPADDDGPAWFALDDVRLAPVPAAPPEPPGPEPPASTEPPD